MDKENSKPRIIEEDEVSMSAAFETQQQQQHNNKEGEDAEDGEHSVMAAATALVNAVATATAQTEAAAANNNDCDKKNSNKTWDDHFAALVAYKQTHGDCFVPVNYEEDATLGRWCSKQRKYKDTLKPERCARLEYIGFSFVNPKQALADKNWNENFERWRAFHAANDGSKMDPVLNRWVSRQRRNRKDGTMSEERKETLDGVGFVWALLAQKPKDYSKKDIQWINVYNELAAFRQEHSHCNVMHGRTKYAQLAKWVARQRELYFQDRLQSNRKDLLNSLGFCWSMEEKTWKENFERFKLFVDQHNHLNIQQLDPPLGRWWYSQRLRHANGKMTMDRIKLLESLGVRFDGTKAYMVPEELEHDANNNNTADAGGGMQIQASKTVPTFTLEAPMRPPNGTKVRKKRFMEGWSNGEVISQEARRARVKYDKDGDEEYLSEEELRVCTIAYQLHSSPPKPSQPRMARKKRSKTVSKKRSAVGVKRNPPRATSKKAKASAATTPTKAMVATTPTGNPTEENITGKERDDNKLGLVREYV